MENERFREIDEILGIQQEKNASFSSIPPKRDRDRSAYRRVRLYTKSVGQYKRERRRRRWVRLLAERGLTQEQIASALDVSTRTIKRDWNKIRPYVKGQVHREIRQVEEARQKEFEQRYEGLAVNEKLKLLKQDLKEAARMAHRLQPSSMRQDQRQQSRRQLDYILDLDSPTADGLPSVTVPPQGSFPLSGGFEMKFYAIKNGEKRELFNVGVSTKTTSPFH